MPGGTWIFDPGVGGVKIPKGVKVRIEQRLRDYAAGYLASRFTLLEIRFKGQFCYIDAYTEPKVSENWPPSDYPETREQMIERLRNIPTHL